MKCSKCPLFHSWNNESDRGESCGLFGDAWDNDLQYEDKSGCVVGCYVLRGFIEKLDRRYMEHIEKEAAEYAEWLDEIEAQKVDEDDGS